MKLEQTISHADLELCFLLNAENEAEEQFLKMVAVEKGYFQWHDGRIALRTNLFNKKVTNQ